MSAELIILLMATYAGAIWLLGRVVGFNRLGDDAE